MRAANAATVRKTARVPGLLAVAAVDRPGGAEVVLLRLLRRWVASGWDVTLASPRGELARQVGMRGLALPLGGLRRGEGARAALSMPRARRAAANADAVYLNGGVPARLLPALAGRARTVLHVHDVVARVPAHWRRADRVLAPSHAAAARLRGLAVDVVGCPVDLAPGPLPPPWPAGDGRPVAGFVGRIEPRKGVHDLAAAAPRLAAAGVRVVLVGEDDFGTERAYRRRVLAAEGIEHAGRVEDAARIMHALAVLVLPSHEEPGGTVVGEAYAAGTPVVATRVGGLPEVVQDGVTGRLVPPGDPPALAAAILDVLSRRETMAAAALAAAPRFDADVTAARIEGMLRA